MRERSDRGRYWEERREEKLQRDIIYERIIIMLLISIFSMRAALAWMCCLRYKFRKEQNVEDLT